MSQSERKTYDTFRSIHTEVMNNVAKLRKAREESDEINQKIHQKEQHLFSLQEELGELRSQNEENRNTIQSNELKANFYKTQNDQLNYLISFINEKIARYENLQPEKNVDLPIDVRNKVGMKIDEILQMVSAENTYVRLDLIEEERQNLRKLEEAIDNEIEILKKFPQDWHLADLVFDLAVEECATRFNPSNDDQNDSSNDNANANANDNFVSFSSVNIPMISEPPILIEHNRTVPPPMPVSVDHLQKEIDSFVSLIQNQNDFVKSIYTSQLEYLVLLRDTLKERPLTNKNQKELKYQLLNQLQRMNQLNEIYPLQIPDSETNEKTSEDPFKLLSESFLRFTNELNKNHEAVHHSLCDDLLESSEKSLYIPPFELPPKKKYIKKPIPSKELVELAENLNGLIQSTKTISSKYEKENEEPKFKEISRQNIPSDFQILADVKSESETDAEKLLQIPLPKIIPNQVDDFPLLGQFKELVKSKLPDQFKEYIDIPNFDLQVEDIPSTSTFESVSDESPIESHVDERSKALNNILADIASSEIPPIPHFTPPTPADVCRVEQVDSAPLLESINMILSPSQESVPSLTNDIIMLEQSIDEFTMRLVNESEDEDDSERRLSEVNQKLDNVISEKERMEMELKTVVDELTQLSNLEKEVTLSIADMEEKLVGTITPEILREKEDELRRKKEELDQKYRQTLKMG